MSLLSGSELKEALGAARIPARYHRPECTLTKLGAGGEHLANWINSGTAHADLRAGVGKFLHGKTQTAVDTFFTLARSLTLVGVSVKVFSLPMLVRSLGTPELREDLQDVSALCIAGFFEPKHAGAFTPAQLNELEWFFRSRWNSETATIFFSSAPMKQCKDWWSESFLSSLATFTSTEVAL